LDSLSSESRYDCAPWNAASIGTRKVHPLQAFRVSLSEREEMRDDASGVPAGAGSARGVLRVFITVPGYHQHLEYQWTYQLKNLLSASDSSEYQMTHSIDSLNVYILVILGIAYRCSIPISSPNINHRLGSIRSSLEGEDLCLTLGKYCIGIEK
jgi:hypothetical protein